MVGEKRLRGMGQIVNVLNVKVLIHGTPLTSIYPFGFGGESISPLGILIQLVEVL
jgi:hypothetical protein